jgi:hypothetical protein
LSNHQLPGLNLHNAHAGSRIFRLLDSAFLHRGSCYEVVIYCHGDFASAGSEIGEQ